MKNIIITFIIIIASLSGFSQSFSVDSKSLSVPRYANQAAITAAFTTPNPAPTEGMLVFNNALDLFVYWNGTAWISFPAAGGQINPIDSTRIISAARIPSLQALKTSGTIAAPGATPAGRLFNIQSYGRSSTSTFLSSEISFRAPQAFTNNSDPASSEIVFSTKGVAAPLTDRMIITENGRFGFGSISSAGFVPSGFMDLNAPLSTDQAPTLHLRGSAGTTHIRYSRNNATGPGVGIVQLNSIGNNAPENAAILWKHYDDTVNPVVQTTMMSITGQGNLTVNGFTKLGGSAADVPAIKTKILTGTMPNAATTTIAVPHGLTASKIIEAKVMITGFTNLIVSDNYTPTVSSGGTNYGFLFNTNVEGANINIVRNTSTTSSSNGIITAGGITATYKIYITYIP